MPTIPDGKAIIEVGEREFPYGGVTHTKGSVLLVNEETAEYACDDSDPPFAERVDAEEAAERGLFRRVGLVSTAQPAGEGGEAEEAEQGPRRFSPGALTLLKSEGVHPTDYDGPATGSKPNLPGPIVTREDAERYLSGGASAEEDLDEIPEVDITSKAAELADDLGVDPREVEGTGKNGRILTDDIREAAEE